MGLLNKVKKKIKKARKAVKKAAKKVKKAVSSVGNAIGNAIENIPNKIFEPGSYLNRVSKAVLTALISTPIRGAFDLIGAAISIPIQITGGIFTLSGELILGGIKDLFIFPLGVLFVGAIDIIAMFQSIFFIQSSGRKLDGYELEILKRIFHDGLNYDVITVIEDRSGIFGMKIKGIDKRALTKGNTIYMKFEYRKGPRMSIDDECLIVHEVLHVWQFQKFGTSYTSESAFAQLLTDAGYSWEHEIKMHDKENWSDFNFEAQAKFIEDLHEFGRQFERTSETHGNYPEQYDFPGSFFIQTKRYKPIFAYRYGSRNITPAPTTSDPSGWLEPEWKKIDLQTDIGLRAMKNVRK